MTEQILYVGMKYDYGDSTRGLSYEHRNFYASIKRYCEDRSWRFDYFDFMAFAQEHGIAALSDELFRRCAQLRPTVLFSVLYHFDFDPHYEVFRDISRKLGVVTCNWFCDDQWRFESYSATVAPHFDYVCTTSQVAVEKYKKAGLAGRLVKSQWGCNTDLYKPTADLPNIDATFVGQPHGNRKQMVEHLITAGIPVDVFGFGWPGRPRIPFHQMVRLFSRSRINLNLSKASTFVEEQIKGRNFEIPGTGGFQLSFDAENLNEYYENGKEIVLVRSIEEMAEKAIFYLNNEAERRKIATAGYERTLREHTWKHRFDQVFESIGLNKTKIVARGDQIQDTQFTSQRVDELRRVNKELWEGRTYFLEKIDYLEKETQERSKWAHEIALWNAKLKRTLDEERANFNHERQQVALDRDRLIREAQELKRACNESATQAESLRAHNRHLEDTIRGLTALKIYRLRHAIKHDPLGPRKFARIGYLLASMAVPGSIRSRLSPATIAIKRSLGIIPPAPKAAPTPKDVYVTQKPWRSDTPLLSVIIPSYNYGRFIEAALNSVLQQTFQDFEVLIIDCSSDPSTINLLKTIHHPKVRVVFREGRHYLGDNRNFGIGLARGKYVTCLDPDDIIKPTYYEKAVYILENGHYDIVSTSVQEFEQGNGRWLLHVRPELLHLLEMNLISVVAVYRKEIWKRANGFHDYGIDTEHVHEDWDFWIRSMALGARVMNIREPLMWYRIHGNNMSKAKNLPSLDEQKRRIREFNRKILNDRSIEASTRRNQDWYRVSGGLVNLLPSEPAVLDEKTILFALPYAVVGGAHKRFLELGRFLKERGYTIVVVTTVETADHQENLLSEYESITRDIFPLPEVLSDQLDWNDCIAYLIKSRAIGTIVLGGSQFFYDNLSWLKANFPSLRVVDQQFNLHIHFDNNRSNCAYIDYTVVENEAIIERLKELGCEGKVKYELIRNGVDTQGDFAPPREPVKRPDTIAPDQIVVSFIGRISHEKGPDVFLDIVEQLSHDSRLYFICAGPGPMFEELCVEVKKRGLESRVWMPGAVNSREFLSFTDILVLPSRIDGRPNIVLEALSLGIPVVAAQLGGLPFLVRDGETGFLCPTESVVSFVARIKTIADNPELHSNMRQAARDFAVQHLDCSMYLPRYLDILEPKKSG